MQTHTETRRHTNTHPAVSQSRLTALFLLTDLYLYVSYRHIVPPSHTHTHTHTHTHAHTHTHTLTHTHTHTHTHSYTLTHFIMC